MIRIAICDDEKECIDEVQKLLDKFLSKNFDYTFLTFNSGQDLLSNYDKNFPIDILFMDVMMEGLNGIETVKILKKQQPQCIVFFVTYHNSFIPEMFRLDAFQFLQKPINEKDFRIDLKRAIDLHVHCHKHLEVKTKEYVSKIPITKVIYVSVHNKHINIITTNKTYFHNGNIAEYDAKLKGYGFAHCHKSFLINLNYVKHIGLKDLELKGVTELIPVSRNYKSNFLKQFNNFNFGTKI